MADCAWPDYEQLGEAEKQHVELLRSYLRIRTVHPAPAYAEVVEFLLELGRGVGLECEQFEMVEGKPFVLMKWVGEDPQLPSLLLNSHTDVVPVQLEKWIHDPFAAHIDEAGDIYARGIQDMKSVGVQHLLAVAALKKKHGKMRRTIYLSFVPDEEIGSGDAMALWVHSDRFKAMNVGLALDEGLANPANTYTIFYGERAPWWLNVIAEGAAGHGSRFVEPSAVERLLCVLDKARAFRADMAKKVAGEHGCGKPLGDVTTLNITMLSASMQHNVVPGEARAGIDIRIPPHVDLVEMTKMLDEWTAGEGVRYEFFVHTAENKTTSTTDDNVWWCALKAVLADHGVPVDLQVFPAATDSRFLRLINVPAFGFSPMRNTPILLHDHNERLHVNTFLEGIPVFEKIITGLVAVE